MRLDFENFVLLSDETFRKALYVNCKLSKIIFLKSG
jgi:hypothetical protein